MEGGKKKKEREGKQERKERSKKGRKDDGINSQSFNGRRWL